MMYSNGPFRIPGTVLVLNYLAHGNSIDPKNQIKAEHGSACEKLLGERRQPADTTEVPGSGDELSRKMVGLAIQDPPRKSKICGSEKK